MTPKQVVGLSLAVALAAAALGLERPPDEAYIWERVFLIALTVTVLAAIRWAVVRLRGGHRSAPAAGGDDRRLPLLTSAERSAAIEADLRAGYFDDPEATEEGFRKALPELREERRRRKALRDGDR